jgi:hypothetical protein
MQRPKFTAPTAQWEEYVDRFLATFPSSGECAIVQHELARRRSACYAKFNGKQSTAMWRDRGMSANRLTQQIIDYKWPQYARPVRKTKTKKVKHYYAVIH